MSIGASGGDILVLKAHRDPAAQGEEPLPLPLPASRTLQGLLNSDLSVDFQGLKRGGAAPPQPFQVLVI
jgi:hypothetical protein